MARSPVSPEAAGSPRLLDQLMVLPPMLRIVVGAVMLVLGGVAIVMHVSPYSLALLGLGVMLGLPLLLHGVADRRRRCVEREELSRAKGELPDLRAAIVAAAAEKQNVRRVLRGRGYTTEKAMRWIALECDVVLSRGDGLH